MKLIVLVIVLCVLPVHCGKWFMYRMLRNAGLSSVIAYTHDDCVNKCTGTNGCSAVSYQQSSGKCVLSVCNNLDLYKANAWNTYVIPSAFIEGRDLRAVELEWALTDNCGSDNQGAIRGPSMNLYSVSYNKSLSAFSGKAVKFDGTLASKGQSNADTNINNPLGNQSLTFMTWVNWAAVTNGPFIEFVGGSTRYIHFWFINGGLYYNIGQGTTGCSGSCNPVYPFTPTVNTWYHVTYVYDGSLGIVQVYLNTIMVAVYKTGNPVNSITWDKGYIAVSSFYGNFMLNSSLSCMKLTKFAASQDEIVAMANSCSSAKIRLSG